MIRVVTLIELRPESDDNLSVSNGNQKIVKRVVEINKNLKGPNLKNKLDHYYCKSISDLITKLDSYLPEFYLTKFIYKLGKKKSIFTEIHD